MDTVSHVQGIRDALEILTRIESAVDGWCAFLEGSATLTISGMSIEVAFTEDGPRIKRVSE